MPDLLRDFKPGLGAVTQFAVNSEKTKSDNAVSVSQGIGNSSLSAAVAIASAVVPFKKGVLKKRQTNNAQSHKSHIPCEDDARSRDNHQFNYDPVRESSGGIPVYTNPSLQFCPSDNTPRVSRRSVSYKPNRVSTHRISDSLYILPRHLCSSSGRCSAPRR